MASSVRQSLDIKTRDPDPGIIVCFVYCQDVPRFAEQVPQADTFQRVPKRELGIYLSDYRVDSGAK